MNNIKNKKILVVDDDPAITDLLSVSLKIEGFDVNTARNFLDASMSVQETKPDLVILDMMLADTSGLKLIKLLQKSENEKIPIIVISGEIIENEVRTMVLLEPNVQEYLLKPLNMQELVPKIRALLD